MEKIEEGVKKENCNCNCKTGFFGFFRSLLCDNGGGMSMGRIGLWLTLSPAIYLWWNNSDIKENHLYILGFFLIYNSYKKIPMFITLIKAWRGKD